MLPPQKAYPLNPLDGVYGPFLPTHDTGRFHGPKLYVCPACAMSDHFTCENPSSGYSGDGGCYCQCNYRPHEIGRDYDLFEGVHSYASWVYWRVSGYDPLPATFSKARIRWAARNARPVPTDVIHLHAIIVKGKVEWMLTYKNTKVCKEEGRCVRLALEANQADVRVVRPVGGGLLEQGHNNIVPSAPSLHGYTN